MWLSVNPANSLPADDNCAAPAMSQDGLSVAFTCTASNLGLDNSWKRWQVYRWVDAGNLISAVSTADGWHGGEFSSEAPAVNGDGSRVAFQTLATSLAPGAGTGTSSVVLWEKGKVQWNLSRRIDGHGADGDSSVPSLDRVGRVVAFVTDAGDLATGGVGGVDHVVVGVLP
jgi:hypothetical protein